MRSFGHAPHSSSRLQEDRVSSQASLITPSLFRHIFEKSLITKHLSTTNQCPLTGQPLNQTDLLDLNTAQATPPNLSTQVPHILQSAAACFDQLQMEKLKMQEALLQTRKELSHALY